MSGVENQQTGLAWSVDGAVTFCSDHTTFLRSRERASPFLGTIGVSSCCAVYGPCGRPQREPLDVRTEYRKCFWPRCYRTFGLRRTGNMVVRYGLGLPLSTPRLECGLWSYRIV